MKPPDQAGSINPDVTGRIPPVDPATAAPELREVFGRQTEQQIVELAATIAVEHFRAKFNTALGVQSQGLCFLPPR